MHQDFFDGQEILDELQKNSAQSLELEYNNIYRNINSATEMRQKMSKGILMWLLNAERTLSAAELIAAVGFDSNGKPVMLKPDQMLFLCHSLVAFDAGLQMFTFAHVSCRDFLQRNPELSGNSAHTMMAKRCLEVLSVGYGIFSRQESLVHDRTLLKYSRIFWPIHYANVVPGTRSDDLKEALLTFIFQGTSRETSTAFEMWLEHAKESISSLNTDNELKIQLEAAIGSSCVPFFLACAFGFPEVLMHLQKSPGFDVLFLQRNTAGQSGMEIAIQ